MHSVTTKRLSLIALSLEQLESQLIDPQKLEVELGLSDNITSNKNSNSELLDALPSWIDRVKKNPNDFEWYTNWMIVDRSEKKAVGGINITRMGENQEQLLIGYHIKQDYRRKGYAIEAVKGICNWAFSDFRIEVILAETERSNLPSEALLSKNGFEFFEEKKGVNIWVLKRPV